jgi:4-carboxymuconolactone decarboxylase
MRQCHGRQLAVFLLGAAALLLGTYAGGAQTGAAAPGAGSSMPSDIDPKSGFRLPLPNREDLDEAGKRTYDRGSTPGANIAGLQGPAGVQLYSPKTTAHLTAINRYLRFEAGFTGRIREIAMLATAREMDSQFEWVAHEPEALKEGVPPAVIDVIKHRKSTEGLDENDALVIELARQLWRDHKVKSETFAALKAIYGPHRLIDLVLLMGAYANTAALLAAVDMQLHPGKVPLLPVP